MGGCFTIGGTAAALRGGLGLVGLVVRGESIAGNTFFLPVTQYVCMRPLPYVSMIQYYSSENQSSLPSPPLIHEPPK